MKKRHVDYHISQKIHSKVRPFTRLELDNREFNCQNSSILRVLTKWAEYLEEVFKNPEESIKNRLYSFINIHNELCNLSEGEEGIEKLIRQLKE